MQILLVSSPGDGRVPHWSHAFAADLASAAAQQGDAVRWLAATHAHEPPPCAGEGLDTELVVLRRRRPRSAARVAAGARDLESEKVLVRWMRELPSAAVVHVGVGARGSPNVLWLAERLGAARHAVLRSPELVCARGDLVDRDGRPCTQHDDFERCRRCVTSWWQRPRATDLQNRADLLFAGLAAASSISVEDDADAARVRAFVGAAARVGVGAAPEDVLARIRAER